MRLAAALRGDLKKIMKQELADAELAVTYGVSNATEGLQMAMRNQVLSANLGNRLSKTWRADIYPFGGRSINTAGYVFTKAEKIMAGFERSTVITSKDGWWLAIPTSNAPKYGIGGKRINPSNFPESQLGGLRFIYRRGKPSLLVVDNARASYSRKTGQLRGFRKASDSAVKKGRNLTTVVMFLLVPQVKMPKLIDFEGEAALWYSRLPKLILESWPDRSNKS